MKNMTRRTKRLLALLLIEIIVAINVFGAYAADDEVVDEQIEIRMGEESAEGGYEDTFVGEIQQEEQTDESENSQEDYEEPAPEEQPTDLNTEENAQEENGDETSTDVPEMIPDDVNEQGEIPEEIGEETIIDEEGLEETPTPSETPTPTPENEETAEAIETPTPTPIPETDYEEVVEVDETKTVTAKAVCEGETIEGFANITVENGDLVSQAPEIKDYEFVKVTLDGNEIASIEITNDTEEKVEVVNKDFTDEDGELHEAVDVAVTTKTSKTYVSVDDSEAYALTDDIQIVFDYKSTKEDEIKEGIEDGKYIFTAQYRNLDGENIEGYEAYELTVVSEDSEESEEESEDKEIKTVSGSYDLTKAPEEIEEYEFINATIDGTEVSSIDVETIDIDSEEAKKIVGEDGEEKLITKKVVYSYTTADGEKIEISADTNVVFVYGEEEFVVAVDASVVDEFGKEIDAKYTNMELPKFDEELALDDTENPPYDRIRTKISLLKYKKYDFVMATIDDVVVKALKKEPTRETKELKAKEQEYVYSYTVDGEEWIKLKEDTTIMLEYTDGEKTVFEYEDSNVLVTAILEVPGAIPDDAEFRVTQVTPETSGYNYDAYMEAVNASSDTKYTEKNFLLYDVAFMSEDEDGNLVEVEPAEGAVKISMFFKQHQLSDDLKLKDDSKLEVFHMPLSDSVMESVSSTEEATSISSKDIKVERVNANSSIESEKIDMTVNGFSLYGLGAPPSKVEPGTSKSYKDMLGQAVYYGIVADTVKLGGHMDTNFAIITMKSNGNNTTQGVYTGSHNPGDDIIVYSDAWFANNYGDSNAYPYTIFTTPETAKKFSPNMYDPKRTYINIDTSSYSENELINKVNGMISGTASSAMAGENKYVKFVDIAEKDPEEGDKYRIDLTSYVDGTYYINFEPGEYAQYLASASKLRLKINPNQNVVLNIPDSSVNLHQFQLDAGSGFVLSDRQDSTADAYAQKVCFNLYNASNVKIESSIFGVVLAPSANVFIQGTSTGWLVANTVSNGGEWHMVWQEMPPSEVPATFEMKVKKTVDGNEPSANDNGKFTFTLTDEATGTVVDTVTNNGGEVVFNNFGEVKNKGEYWYSIRETKADGAYSVDGTVYYACVNVTSTVKPAEKETIYRATVTYHKGSKNGEVVSGLPTFNNKKIEPIKIKLRGRKFVNGKEIYDVEEGRFKFTIRQYTKNDQWGNVIETVTNDKDGYFEFSEMSFDGTGDTPSGIDNYKTYYFKINESSVATGYGKDETAYIAKVILYRDKDSDPWKSEIKYFKFNNDKSVSCKNYAQVDKGDIVSEMTFNNRRYDPEPAEFEFKVTKKMKDGSPWPAGAKFTFKLERLPKEETAAGNRSQVTRYDQPLPQGGDVNYVTIDENTPNHTASFGTVDFAYDFWSPTASRNDWYWGYPVSTDCFMYKITEVVSNENTGIIYDTHTQFIKIWLNYHDSPVVGKKVTVEANGSTNQDKCGGTLGDVVFINEYKPKQLQISKRDDNNKALEGATLTLKSTNGGKINGTEDSITWVTGSSPKSVSVDFGHQYVIEETKAPIGYNLAEKVIFSVDTAGKVTIDGNYGEIDGKDTVVIIVRDMLKTVNIEGEKTWNDNNNRDGKRPESITIRLMNGSKQVDSKVVTPDSKGNWYWSFEGLPEYENGNKIEYTVVEDAVEGYTTRVDGYDVINTHETETTEVSGSKTWADNNNQDGKRPTSITINLLADGVEIDEKVVTAKDNWAWSFTELPIYKEGKSGQKIVYTITEDAVTGYTTSVNKYDVTNTHTTETVDISGVKDWADNNNQDGKRPASITINLLKNGTQIDSKTVSSPWTWEWKDLPKYEGGQEIEYSFEEAAVDNYGDPVYGTTSDGKIKITNKHTPETTEVNGSKTWDDSDNQDGKRPSSITIRVWDGNNEVAHQTVEPDEKGNWSWSFTNLPKYDDGREIEYKITEDKVDGYSTTYSDEGYDVTNKYTPETTNISGSKTWVDSDNQDGKRPASITVRLLANGKETGDVRTIVPDTNGNWPSWNFDNLPKYNNGKLITYTISEDTVPGYETSITDGNITNTHIPETTYVEGKKTWVDGNNQDGKRPSSITVNLLANGVKVDSKPVSADAMGNWTWKFENLPKYSDGTVIKYTFDEENVSEYTKSISEDGKSITNTHTPEKTTINGTKTWQDNNNQDGKRPTKITVKLMNGTTLVDSLEVKADAEGNWKYEFKDLPKYANGTEIHYSVVEEAVDGYSVDYPTGSFDIVNKYTPEKTNVAGKKTWTDNNNQDGKRPASITINLLADGQKVNSKVVTAQDNWAWNFNNLDKFKGGKEIVYTITEDEVKEYTSEISGYDVENTHTTEKTSVEGAKTWKDSDNRDGVRPSSITINLLADGAVKKTQVVKPDEEGNWSYKFDNLDKYADGKEIVYTVTEEVIAGYTTSVNGYNITNTHDLVKTEKSGHKTWNDNGNQDGKRPGSIKVSLFADGNPAVDINGKEVAAVTVTEKENWSWKFENLPKYANGSVGKEIVYTVEEEKVDGYTTTLDGMNLTNTHTPEKIDVNGTKVWNDNENQDGVRPGSITVNLFADGEDTGKSVVAYLPDYTWSFKDLEKYKDGKAIAYTVTEVEVSGYTTSIDNKNYVITNTHNPEVTSVDGTKTWNDNDNQDGKRPASIIITLLADGQEAVDANGEKVAAKTVTEADGWSWSFGNLPLKKAGSVIKYSVVETIVNGYIPSYDGYNVTNTWNPEKTSVSGIKTWADADDQDGIRPDSITVTLYADGTKKDSLVVTPDAEGNWKYEFTNLDKYKNGTEIKYTVTEEKIKGYEPQYTSAGIINTHVPETTKVEGTKTWVDNNDQDGVRPTEITVNLYKNGSEEPFRTKTISGGQDNQWSYEFDNLPKYENGVAIVYTVDETLPEGYEDLYTSTVNGYNITNKHTPEVTNISGTKTWSDNDNQDNARPESIVIRLMNGTKEVDYQIVKPNAQGVWSWSFNNLPKKDNGTDIVYTIIEDPVKDYTTNVDGYNVINTHSPEKTAVEGVKTWADADNQDGIRPSKITVNLLKNGKKIDSQEVTEANGWKWSFKNLDRYENGKEIQYSVSEEVVSGYKPEVNGYNITNTHIPETINLSGQKTWEDNNNQDGIRPASIGIILKADGTQYRTATASAPNWDYSFTNLPKYKNGTEIKYTIDEVEVPKYTKSVDGLDITNTHEPEKTYVEGYKIWDDSDNQDNKRPTEIIVNLYANGEFKESLTVKPNAQGSWYYKFDNLDKKAEGKDIEYKVTEEKVDDYSTSYSGYNITNSYTPGKVNISGSKTWDDADNQDGIRPESITVTLFADGKEVTSKVVTAADKWEWSFNNLDEYKKGAQGQKIVYSVSEVQVPGYEEPIVDGYNIKNTHTPETIDINGQKKWVDANNQDGIRPTEITVELYADNLPYQSVKAVAPDYKYEFKDLPKYKKGENGAKSTEINYVVKEVAVDGYTCTVDGYNLTNTHIIETVDVEGSKTWEDADNQDGARPTVITINLLSDGKIIDSKNVTEKDNWSWKWTKLPKNRLDENNASVEIKYSVSEEPINMNGKEYTPEYVGFDIINHYTPGKTYLEGSKVWEDSNNQDGIRPESIRINLLADGVAVDYKDVTAADNWAWTFDNLDEYRNGKKIVYTVSESKVEGYETSISGNVVTNTHIPATVKVEGHKTWEDNDDQDNLRPEKITVNLLADGEIYKSMDVAGPDWNYRFTDLPKFKAGEEIEYTIQEIKVDNYDSALAGYDLTNTHKPEIITLEGKKTWEDSNNQDGKRPKEITIHLLANGSPAKYQSGQTVDAYVATESNNWSWKFENLPKYAKGDKNPISYTITEDPVEGYTSDINGMNVTNKYTPGKTGVSGFKTWDDSNDQDGVRPESITISLLANGEPALYQDGTAVASVVASKANNWSWEFKDLPEYKDGSLIKYSIVEEEADELAKLGYESNIDGFNVTNTRKPETTTISGTKTWKDFENQDGKRPTNITIMLYADGSLKNTVSVTAADSWAWTFENLPVYRDGGQKIEYTIEEAQVTDYETEVKGYDVINTHKPETTEVSGSKTWVDEDNIYSTRPEYIEITLKADNADAYYQDGSQVEPIKVRPDENGKWSWKFENLPKYALGKVKQPINYSVVETAIDATLPDGTKIDYSTVTNGMDVINTYTPGKDSITVKKIWDDNDNQDNNRKENIKVALYAKSGALEKEYDGPNAEVYLDDKNNWSYTWNNLPKYKDSLFGNKQITYTVKEITEVPGYDKPAYSDVEGGIITITNTLIPEKIKLEGIKNWDDGKNQDGVRPSKITLKVYGDNDPNVPADVIEVTGDMKADSWEWESKELDKNYKGKENKYTIEEILTDADGKNYTLVGEGPVIENGKYIFTNKHDPAEISIKAIKVWEDAANGVDNFYQARPETIRLTLYANGEQALDKEGNKIAPVDVAVDPATDAWEYTWKNLPEYRDGEKLVYTVGEIAVDDYDGDITGPVEAGTDADGNKCFEFTLTNTFSPDLTNVKVVKAWQDNDDQDGYRPTEITVQLYEDKLIDKAIGEPVTLTEADDWTYEWTNLPRTKKSSSKGDVDYNYTVKEISVKMSDGTTMDIDDFNKKFGYKGLVSEFIDNNITITNTHEPEVVKVEGEKSWEDKDNQDGKRPESITIRLLADGEEIDHKTVTASDKWKWSFDNLPKRKAGKEIKYTIVEDEVDAYTSTINGFDVVNTHETETVNISGTKIWKGDKEGYRPESITVILYANGKVVDSRVVTPINGKWEISFGDLDKYKDGELIEYTVEESSVSRYKSAIDRSVNYEDGTIFFTLTNTYIPPKPTPTPTPPGPPTTPPSDPPTGPPSTPPTITPPPTPTPPPPPMGYRRTPESGTVLGARRGMDQAVLGKRRRPQTGDSLALYIWIASLISSLLGAGACTTGLIRTRKK